MKKLKVLLLIIFLFPISVFADSEMVSVECPSNIKKDKEFTCKVLGASSYDVYSVELEYVLPDYLTKVSADVDPIWQGQGINDKFYVYTDVPKKVSFNIGTLTLKSNKDINKIDINIIEAIYSDSNYEEHYIIEKNNVNNVEINDKKELEKKNNNSKYVIIILIIGTLVVGFVIYIKIRSGKNEK